MAAPGTFLGRPRIPTMRLLLSRAHDRLLESLYPSLSSSLPSNPVRVPRTAWLCMQSHALSSGSSLRGLQCLWVFKGNAPARYRTPLPPADGELRHPLSKKLLLPRLPNSKTLLDGHGTEQAKGVGGIAFALIWGGEIQNQGCCQKFNTTRPHRGKRCLLGEPYAFVWASSQLVELGPLCPYVPSATIGHGDDINLEIHRKLEFRLGAGL